MAPSAPILILAATRPELEPLLRESQAGEAAGGPAPAFAGTLGGEPVVLSVTGVGKGSAAFTAGLLFGARTFRALVSVGCAGAFRDSGLSPGEVVIADREILSDEGTMSPAGFLDLEQLSLPAAEVRARALSGTVEPIYNLVPIRPPLRLDAADLAALSRELGFPIRAGPVSTASTCSGTDARAREVAARWRPMAESMEGGALALAALRSGIPFLEVRGISNFTGDRDRAAWQVGLAVERASAAVARLIRTAGRWVEPAAQVGIAR